MRFRFSGYPGSPHALQLYPPLTIVYTIHPKVDFDEFLRFVRTPPAELSRRNNGEKANLRRGDRVEAHIAGWTDGIWYPGTVSAENADGSFAVRFPSDASFALRPVGGVARSSWS